MQRCIPYQQENTSTILATAEENCWLLSDVLRYILEKKMVPEIFFLGHQPWKNQSLLVFYKLNDHNSIHQENIHGRNA